MGNYNFKMINKKLCPFIQNPFDECYCTIMTSQDIERAVYLCSNNFEKCDIYKNVNNGKKREMIKNIQTSI
jgi:hypothetical protein